jgi:hypothetical protein
MANRRLRVSGFGSLLARRQFRAVSILHSWLSPVSHFGDSDGMLPENSVRAQWGVYPIVILVIPGIAQVSKPTALPCQRIRRFRFDPGANLSPTTSPPARPSQPATPWPNRKLHEASCIIRGRRAPSLPKSLNTARHALRSVNRKW